MGNVYDTFEVAVKKDDEIVGHCPRKLSAICSIFIRRGGKITCQVTGRRQHPSDLPQGGLEIPCKLTFHTNKKREADKTAKLIKNALSKNITNTETAVDVNFSSCPTSASKSQHSSSSVSFASINLDDDMEQPAKKQKLGSKDVEDIIMGIELYIRPTYKYGSKSFKISVSSA